MSTIPEQSTDFITVACVVEASLLIALEWHRVLMEYVYPLLKRLSELHPSHQFRLGFVTYGAADTRPQPLLSKRFFAPLSQVSKELREEPSKLGIGQTNSGSGRGLSALEGLVAAIELFDMLMMSTNFAGNHGPTSSPQKENRSLISHLIHIAASPPDNAQRPQHNTLSHLDSVSWDSIPTELKKRKINLSLISLRNIPQFQELQSAVAGSATQPPWFSVRAPHILLLAGFPMPQRTSAKRLPDTPSDQSPDAKRQKVSAEPISKTSSASPALPPARIPQSQHSQQPTPLPPQQLQPTTVSNQNSTPSSTQPAQSAASAPAPVSTNATPSVSLPPPGPSLPTINAEVLEQVVAPTGLKFGQMMERLRALEREIVAIDSQISNPQNAGQAPVVAGLRKDLAHKIHIKEQIKTLLKQHYQKMLLAKEALNSQIGAAGPALHGSAEAGPSTQSQPPNVPSTSNERLAGPAVEEHKPPVSVPQMLAQFWQSRGGTISGPNGSNPQMGANQTQPSLTLTPELAAQMQKLIEKKGIRPQNFGPSSGTSREVGTNPNATSAQPIQARPMSAWNGTFSWTFPKGQVGSEVHICVVGIFTPPTSGDVRTDMWPRSLILNPCKEPLKDNTELPSWLKRHKARTHLMQFRSDPRAPDGPTNEQKFHTLTKFMADHRIYVYAGWQLPSGKFSYNIIIFPMGNYFAGAVFPDGLPDLPGSGNALDVQPSVEDVKPPPLGGFNIPPAFLARMQGLDPAKQKQFFALFVRQQEQLRRQQLQQTQQPVAAASQSLNSLGVSLPSNSYNTAVNIPAGPLVSANGPTSSGSYNTGGGAVSYEMMQSFVQRSAEGSTSQGMNLGQLP